MSKIKRIELDTKEIDKEEKELYQMLISKFNTEEMERLAKLMIIDAEKYHQEQLKKNCVLDLVSDCKKLDIHKCLNDIMEITDRRLGIFGVVRGSLRYEYKKAIDKMICCR